MRPALPLLLSLLLFSGTAHAEGRGDGPADPSLEAKLRGSGAVLRLLMAEGTHVGADAPLALGSDVESLKALNPKSRKALLGRRGLSSALEGVLRVGICTEDGMCTLRDFRFAVGGDSRAWQESALESVQRQVEVAGEPPTGPGELTLYKFTAHWCPPCMAMDAEFLDPGEGALELVSLRRVDADEPESWALKSRYTVGGYPTLVLVDAQGALIARQVGYPGAATSAIWLQGALENAVPLAELERPEPGSLEAIPEAKLALRLAAEGCDEGLETLLELAASRLEKSSLKARVLSQLGDCRDKGPEASAAYLEAAQACPTCEDGAWRAWQAVHALEEPSTELLEQALGLARQRLSQEPKPVEGVEWIVGDLLLLADDAPGAQAVWSEGAAPIAEFLAEDSALAAHQELVPPLADLYESLEDWPAHTALLQRASAAFPENFAWPYVLASSLSHREAWKEAEGPAREALKRARGDQVLRAARLLLEILPQLDQKDEARALALEALSRIPEPEDPEIRTHRYREALQEALQSLEL